MDEETAYENRPGRPHSMSARDMVDDLQLRCNALRTQLRALGDPKTAQEADLWLSIMADIEEAESKIVALEEGIGRGQH